MAKKRTVKAATRRRIAEAMKGNNNATKWTEELVVEILNAMIDVLERPYDVESSRIEEEKQEEGGTSVVDENGDVIEVNKGYKKSKVIKSTRRMHLKSELLIHFKIRNAKWFSHMADKFKKIESVSNLFEYIDLICGVNTYNDAANGVTNPAIAKMNLATHHNFSDSVKSDIVHSGSVDVETPEVPDYVQEAFDKARKIMEESNNE